MADYLFTWTGQKGFLYYAKKNVRWHCDQDYNHRYVVRHCQHPTANYPWYTHDENGDLITFRLVKQAKAWVEQQLTDELAARTEVQDA